MKKSTALLLVAICICGEARAEISDGKVKIGVLTDLSGGYEQASGYGLGCEPVV